MNEIAEDFVACLDNFLQLCLYTLIFGLILASLFTWLGWVK